MGVLSAARNAAREVGPSVTFAALLAIAFWGFVTFEAFAALFE